MLTNGPGTDNVGGGAAPPLQRALARTHRWQQMLDAGTVASISELAQREGEDISYIARMLNLTLLAPDIVEAILDETLPEGVRLHQLAINPRMRWDEHRAWLASIKNPATRPRLPRRRTSVMNAQAQHDD